ncbi:MAG: DNA repair protein RecO [Oscillospiraceae bacterium]|nr:DNA repair protein RecO [Oscillospiraceae bacterium]
MLVNVDGLVISRRDFGDSSCFVDIFTGEYGVIEVAAKGVKKLNNPLAQPTGLFTYSAFCLNKKNLKYTINSAKCKHGFHSLSGDLSALSLASYFAELVKFTQLPEQSAGETLKSMLIALTELEHGSPHEQVKSTFEMKLIHALGINHPKLKTEDSEKYLLYHLGKTFKTLDYYKGMV